MRKEAPNGTLPSRFQVQQRIDQAISDEEKVLRRWKDAKIQKRKWVEELLFPQPWVEAAKQMLKPLDRYPETRKKAMSTLRRELKKNLTQETKPFERLTSYKPLDLLKAWLVESWIPSTKLFLESCQVLGNRSDHSTYKTIEPTLQQLGFSPEAFGFLDPDKEKPISHLLRSSPRSLAVKCVAYRSQAGALYLRVLDEEDLKVAHSRIFPSKFSKKQSA